MKVEYEVKILDVDVKTIQMKLRKFGAKKVFDRLMRRYVYDTKPPRHNAWLRLRDDGGEVTLAYKSIDDESRIEGTKEIEVVVSDFDKLHQLLRHIGFVHKAYQENRRVHYELDGVCIEIDFWPKIPPYVEIEGNSRKEVLAMVKKLGFGSSQTTSANTRTIFRKYGIDIYKFKELRF